MRAAVVTKQSHQWVALALYTLTLFLSALLLFSLQPMFTRMVLPRFGGSSSVWAVSIFFYQTLLLLGYALAHVMARHLQPFASAVAQLALLLIAVAVLPVHLPVAWSEPPPGHSYLWLMGALCAGVSLPFLALSVNAPLLQAWFGSLGHDGSEDPYFLYGASNAGSLTALLAYPFLIEPLLALQSQSRLWSAGFAALLLLVAACGAFTALTGGRKLGPGNASAAVPSPVPTWRERALWAGLAFVPAGLVVAFTTFVTTDLASAPLFWTIPLALYLATFVLLFRRRPLIDQRYLLIAQPVSVALTFVALEWFGQFSWLIGVILGTLAYLLTCLLAHGQLYACRPGRERLTDFYLWISIGGALGGLFAAILAPLVFTDVMEFHLLLALGLFCRPDIRERLSARWALPAAAALALVALAAGGLAWEIVPRRAENRFILIAICGAAVIVAAAWPRGWLAAVAALLAAYLILPRYYVPLHAVRTFHGAHRVVESGGGRYHMLFHGTTLHGLQQVGTANGSPPASTVPLGYYHPRSPLAFGIRIARRASPRPGQALNVGIVGLGTGAMACHSRPHDSWRFFEIDPAVAEIASRPELFSYLARCRPDAGIVLGDARLTLAREQPGGFDYLLIDAFSSDAIPVHLLTVEALQLYMSLLSERGVLALHISNLNLDLPPVVESAAAQIPGVIGVYLEGTRGGGALGSQLVLLARDPRLLHPALSWPEARPLGPPAIHAWTDDHADVLSALIRGLQARLWNAPS